MAGPNELEADEAGDDDDGCQIDLEEVASALRGRNAAKFRGKCGNVELEDEEHHVEGKIEPETPNAQRGAPRSSSLGML